MNKEQAPVIMLVDDEPLFLKSTARYFMRKGYHVLAEEKAEKAINRLQANAGTIVLVVVDYDMPAMSGVEFALLVREYCPHVPILMLSGYPPETFTADEHAAVTAILYKPVDLSVVDAYINV